MECLRRARGQRPAHIINKRTYNIFISALVRTRGIICFSGEIDMRKNFWVANDSGYIVFRNAEVFIETSVDKYKGKTTLWIDRYGYYKDADLKYLKALYIEVEQRVKNGGIKQVRLRASDSKELDFWRELGFEVDLRTTNVKGAKNKILLKSLHKPFFGLLGWWQNIFRRF